MKTPKQIAEELMGYIRGYAVQITLGENLPSELNNEMLNHITTALTQLTEQHEREIGELREALVVRKDEGCLCGHEHGEQCGVWCRNMDAALTAFDTKRKEQKGV